MARRSERALAAALLLSAAACTQKPRETVVLLANPDGSPSAVTVTTRGGSQRLERPGQAVTLADAGQAPAASAALSEAEIERRFGAALAARPEPPVTFLLHYRLDTTELTPESKRQLPDVLRIIRARPLPEVFIVGHTDRAGASVNNERLARRRAETVRDEVIAVGVEPRLIQMDSHGENNPLVPTADGVPEPRNRRVEITVR